MLHDFELVLIRAIHQFRTPLLDEFFKFLNFFDRQEFFFLLIPIVWLGRGWKTGLRLFYTLLLSVATNHALKQFFLSPRPFHLDASLGVIHVGGLGFPSGAAQTVILLSGLLLSVWKSSWKWVVVLIYISLISFSRVYLGVHFPTDILAGWFVGFGLFAAYIYLCPPIEKQLEKLGPLPLLALSQIIPISLLISQNSPPTLYISSVALGLGMGVFILYKWNLLLPCPRNFKEYFLRASVGILGTFACYLLTSSFPSFLRFFLLGIWASLGSHLIICKFFKSKNLLIEP